MGYLEHLVESGHARRWTMLAELPTLSRPLYETVHTGLPPASHGIVSNQQVRLSTKPNLFGLAHAAGLTTAASAYCWFSELYVAASYDRVLGREIDDLACPIQHGRFYTEDATPDIETFQAGAMLALRFQPDYLLIHPMGMDYVGEPAGGRSLLYLDQGRLQDAILANLVPVWLEHGYSVIVTADHGMTDDGRHGGSSRAERQVPLYLIDPHSDRGGDMQGEISQCSLAPTICRLLGVPVPESMQTPALNL
jgi:hypothetical protein